MNVRRQKTPGGLIAEVKFERCVGISQMNNAENEGVLGRTCWKEAQR